MKEEKKKIQNNFGVTVGLLVISILYTVAIMFIDVRPIGPQGSVVGFAKVNQSIRYWVRIYCYIT